MCSVILTITIAWQSLIQSPEKHKTFARIVEILRIYFRGNYIIYIEHGIVLKLTFTLSMAHA